MGAPVLTSEQWLEVKQCAEAGLSDSEIAVTFGLSENTIRQRRFYDKKKGRPWLTQKELKLASDIEELKRKNGRESTGLTNQTQGSALATVASRMSAARESGALILAEWMLGLIKKSSDGNMIPAPTTGKALSSIVSVFATATGLGKGGGVQINVGNGMSWSSAKHDGDKPIVMEAEVVSVD